MYEGNSTGTPKLDQKKISSATNENYFFSLILLKFIHMTKCLGICPRTNVYFCFVTTAERGLRQGEHNSTKTSNIKILNFPQY